MPDPAPTAETFATPDDLGDLHASELHSSLGESLWAQASDAFMGGTRTLMRASQMANAQEGVGPEAQAAAEAGGMPSYDFGMPDKAEPDVPMKDAKSRVKQAGLEGRITLPDQDSIRGPVLDLMLDHARERAQYEAAVNRGPQGFAPDALGFLTQMGAGMVDPVNAAAFSIPVLGEARYGQILARAGDSVLARAGVRTAVGAAQGAVGGAVLAPADWWLQTHDGQDYTYADALKSVVLSAGMGGLFHGGFGGVHDLYSRVTDRPLEGAPPIAGTHLPEETLAPGGAAGVNLDEVPGITAPGNGSPAAVSEARQNVSDADVLANPDQQIIPRHPAEVLADLPPRAQEDLVHVAIADVIAGRPVRAAEVLQEAAKDDPRLAEALNPSGAPDNVVPLQAQRRGGPASRDPATFSLLEFLASVGGIRDDDPLISDLRGSVGNNKFIPGFGQLIRKPKQLSTAARAGGAYAPLSLDRAREAAVEAGYIPDEGMRTGGEAKSTIETLLQAVDREARGDRVYREGHAGPQPEVDAEKELYHADGALDQALEKAGIDPAEVTGKTRDRTLQIMLREDMHGDPVGAYERAIMEEGTSGAEASEFEPATEKIPGWDADDEPGAAPGASGAAAEGSAAGGAEAGAQARDRGAIAGTQRQAARGVADFRKFVSSPDPVEDPALAVESRLAEKIPEPVSTEVAKAPTAAQAAAGEADKLLADILPTLAEDERKIFEDNLAQLAQDTAAREQMIREGAACLAAASAEAAA